MIQISTTLVPLELQENPAFKSCVENHERCFNSSKFDTKLRTIICLHEATHLVYARELGFEPRLYGPSVDYDFDTEKFRRLDSSVQGLPYEIRMNADLVVVAKQFLAPVYVEEKLLSHRTQAEIWADALGDVKNYNNWLVQRLQIKGDVHPFSSFDLREATNRDLRSPAFRRRLWGAAREFSIKVFGT